MSAAPSSTPRHVRLPTATLKSSTPSSAPLKPGGNSSGKKCCEQNPATRQSMRSPTTYIDVLRIETWVETPNRSLLLRFTFLVGWPVWPIEAFINGYLALVLQDPSENVSCASFQGLNTCWKGIWSTRVVSKKLTYSWFDHQPQNWFYETPILYLVAHGS